MKTQAMFQHCPKCGKTMDARSKLCGECSPRGNGFASKTIEETCKNCGDRFEIPLWRHNQKRGSFCSKKCHDQFLKTISGPDHPKYTGRFAPVHYSGTNYEDAKAAVMKRAGGKCEWCGIDLSKVKKVSIHHIIGLHKFNSPDEGNTTDNMAVIGQSCHAKHHGLGKNRGEKKHG